MTPTWAQRREALLRDCIVPPDVFTSMVEQLGDFVGPYQRALETEASGRHVHLYLQGLLSHLGRKNAEKIATFVDVERLVRMSAADGLHVLREGLRLDLRHHHRDGSAAGRCHHVAGG